MKNNGFTLVEMLIAIGIFAMLAVSGAALLQGSVSAQDLTRQRLDGLAGEERLSAMLANELGQALARPTRDSAGTPEPAFEGGGDMLLSYVRAGRTNPQEAARGGVERVTWRVVQGRLERTARMHPDGGVDGQPVAILDGVTSATIRFRDGADWRAVWDPVDPAKLPSAIELTIAREGRAPIVRKVMVGVGG